MVQLSLVVPAFAEARYLAGTLRALREFLSARDWLATTEVVVVTAEAPDGTPEIARQGLAAFPLAQHIEPGAKLGKGRDVRAGMLAARGEIVLFMDADLATPLRHVEPAVSLVRAGHDVVIGRRDLARMHHTLGRRITSQLSNHLVRAVLLPGIADTQCGFKAFHRSIVAELFEPLRTMGWGFDLEILVRARAAGASIAELDVPDWADPKGDHGLAGERQWLARLRTLRELAALTLRHGRQPVRPARWVRPLASNVEGVDDVLPWADAPQVR
ncbi:MAG TPA: glycosyltransferase [Kofleriaceae bacterium]|nr:glycosyltransferase [Kofleriaceae bacterium]